MIDLKVKGKFIGQRAADRDLQASCSLALREADQRPARGFAFHTVRLRKGEPSVRATPAARSPGQLEGFWVRVAQAARTLVALYEEYGPDEPWPFVSQGNVSACRPASSPPAPPGTGHHRY